MIFLQRVGVFLREQRARERTFVGGMQRGALGTYSDAVAFLLRDAHMSVQSKEGRQSRSLAPMRALIHAIEATPHRPAAIVHIAGTNGKGSVCAMLDSALRALGHRTALFTSPHLHSFRERIRVDGKLIPTADLIRIVNELAPVIEATPNLHIFDKITAVAYKYFLEQNVDWIVLETGIGGRLDSTNVFQPAACVITSIGFDHMNVLGNTIQEIATEKAGIIKANIPVVVSPLQNEGAIPVFEQKAADVGAPLVIAQYADTTELPLKGKHQSANKGAVLAALNVLQERMLIKWDEEAISRGFRDTRWPARFEKLPPPASGLDFDMIIDGGHNETAIKILVDAAKQNVDPASTVVLFGAGSDKDFVAMAKTLVNTFAHLVIFKSAHPRALPSATIVERLKAEGISTEQMATIHATDDVAAGFDRAVSLCKSIETSGNEKPHPRCILGTGSLFVVAELRELWHRRYPDAFPATDFVHAIKEDLSS
eukprot:TRINITY_DN3977_c0_g1_i2.p1 TRINITY_DN3977_c0_g1~~TRINITY_DN3977_c0_g1_i2.p1  ORF type:complete len:483 (-),score=105.05 TRINITY_DN3977_c0_g1_i2:38-1486(-)